MDGYYTPSSTPQPAPAPVPALPKKKRWWKRWWGITLLILLSLVALFVIWVGYLVYRELRPSPQSLAQNTKEFTVSGEGASNVKVDKTRLVRDNSASLGSSNATIQIVEFVDFECPYCQESYAVIRGLATEYGDRIHYVFRHYPVEVLHEHAEESAIASVCAAEQDKFWPYHDRLFQNQSQLDDDSLRQHALSVGINVDMFDRCRTSEAARATVLRDVADGNALGVRGTPTWFINGERVEGAIPETVFRQIIEALLQQ